MVFDVKAWMPASSITWVDAGTGDHLPRLQSPLRHCTEVVSKGSACEKGGMVDGQILPHTHSSAGLTPSGLEGIPFLSQPSQATMA